MKRLSIILLLAPACYAQNYGRMDFQLQGPQGQAIAGAQVYVYTQPACGAAARGQATLYPTASGGKPLTQPILTNGFGHAYAYVLPGCVTITYQSPFNSLATYSDQTVYSGAVTTFSGIVSAGGAATKTSPHVDITAPPFGCASTLSDNSACLQAAINYSISINADLFIPCGKYQFLTPLTIYSTTGIKIVGQHLMCAALKYTGGTAASGVTISSNSGFSGTAMQALDIEDVSFLGNSSLTKAALDIENAYMAYLKNVYGGTASASTGACIYMGVVEYFDMHNIGCMPGTTMPHYGLVMNGGADPGGDGPHSLTGLVLESGNTGIAFWGQKLFDVSMTGLQISSNPGVQFQCDNCAASIFSGLFEANSSNYNVVVNGGRNVTFQSSQFYNSGPGGNVHVQSDGTGEYPVGTVFRDSFLGAGTTLVDAGTHGTKFINDEVQSTTSPGITDNAVDTEYEYLFDAYGYGAYGGVPYSCHMIQAPPGFLNYNGMWAQGSWTVSSSGATQFCPGYVGNIDSLWRVKFDGTWNQNSSSPQQIEINSSSPTLSVGSATITVSVSSNHLQMTSSSTSQTLFQGTVTFYPDVSTNMGVYASYADQQIVGGLGIGSGTVMTGNQGNGTSVQHSTGTATSGHLVSFDANGNTVDAGRPPDLSGTTGSIGGSVLLPGNCATGTATVTGATTSMTAVASPATYPGAQFFWNAYVSSSNTVTVAVCTDLAAGGTPKASAYIVRVIQ